METPTPAAKAAPKPEAKKVTEAEYWSKNGRFQIGDLAQFSPFVPGFNNMGKLEDNSKKIVICRSEDEHLLFRGSLVTRDASLIDYLDQRIAGGCPIRLHEKRQVAV